MQVSCLLRRTRRGEASEEVADAGEVLRHSKPEEVSDQHCGSGEECDRPSPATWYTESEAQGLRCGEAEMARNRQSFGRHSDPQRFGTSGWTAGDCCWRSEHRRYSAPPEAQTRVNDPDKRIGRSRKNLLAWYFQIPISLPLSLAAVFKGDPWPDILLVYLVAISVWTGIATAHAQLNADLPSAEKE